MGVIAHKGILYGGGSDVEANPQDTATDDLEKVSIDGTVYDVKDADAVHSADVGTANGVAELDANGLVPSSQLPSYVDDVLEYASQSAFPATGETGKIYVALDTNLTYRWSGSAYVEISPSLALGETSSTAYRGDRGKTAYDHATESGRSGAKSAGLYKIGVTAQGHVASASAVAKADLTALGVADQNDVDAIETDIEGYKTATGKYITINDAASLPAESYSLTLSPVQDLNGYDSPWAAGAGVNQWDEEWELGGIDETTGQPFPNNNAIRTKNYIPCQAETNYYYYCGAGDLLFRICYYDSSKNFISSLVITSINRVYQTPQNCAFIKFGMRDTYGTTYNHDIAINYPSSITTYSPYSNICPIHGADEVGVRVCGVNLWDEIYTDIATSVKYKALKVGDGQFTLSSTTPQASGAAQLFLLAGDVSSGASTSDNGVWSGHSKTVTASGGYVTIGYREQYGVSPTDYKTQLEKGSTATTYEPYVLHSTTITLPSTVYGGSVEQGGSGESKYRFKTFDGTENWTWYAPSNSVLLSNGLDYRKGAGETVWVPGLCNMVKTESSTGLLDYYITAGALSSYTLQVAQIGQHFNIENSVDAWKAFLQENNMQLCYEVATPTSISLTPFPQTLLEGVNNVWAEMKENSVVIDNAQQSLSYQPQNIVGQLRQEIEAKPDSFADLTDTAFSNLANGQIPKWNSTTNKWENANESGGGGATSFADLSDTNISNPTDGQIPKWNSTSQKWVNANEYSYSLPTADANTLGGIKVGDNLSIDNSGVLSSNIPAWTKYWNYSSGTTFVMPTGKKEIMLKLVNTTNDSHVAVASNVHALSFPSHDSLGVYWTINNTKYVEAYINENGLVTFWNYSGGYSMDFEIWVR